MHRRPSMLHSRTSPTSRAHVEATRCAQALANPFADLCGAKKGYKAPDMDLIVSAEGVAAWRGRQFACALGEGGVTSEKFEGDLATPIGQFPLRYVLYRPDRISVPNTVLPVAPLTPLDGWCDDPADRRYNRLVCQPYSRSFELLWRRDEIYDLIVVLGYNDAPVVAGRGSAIFLHVARPNMTPTLGCVALRRDDLLTVLAECEPDTLLRVGS